MSYADSDAVKVRLKALKNDIDDDLINECVQSADDTINAKLIETTLPAVIPDPIRRAATLYAAADGLDILYTGEESRDPAATTWENKADKLIDAYLEAHPEEEETKHYTRHNSDRNRPFHGSRNRPPFRRLPPW